MCFSYTDSEQAQDRFRFMSGKQDSIIGFNRLRQLKILLDLPNPFRRTIELEGIHIFIFPGYSLVFNGSYFCVAFNSDSIIEIKSPVFQMRTSSQDCAIKLADTEKYFSHPCSELRRNS